MRILIVEDEIQILDNIVVFFKRQGFAVDQSRNGEEAQFLAEEEAYDCIILDINLPDRNGFTIIKNLRNQEIFTPIILLTARSEEEDKIKGLNLGSDDYLTKPFSLNELYARVQALIRRSAKKPETDIEIGKLLIKTLSRRVFVDNVEILLPSKEYSVLEFLARHRGEVVTRTMIFDHVWGSDFETFSNIIEVYIRNLRKKLHNINIIHTIKGAGYKLELNESS